MSLYEDKLVVVDLPPSPAVTGHVRLSSSAKRFDDVSPEDFAHLFSAASYASMSLFEALGAQGTNILLSDLEGVRGDVLVRAEEDGVSFGFKPLRLPTEEMDVLAAKIKDACDYIGSDVPLRAPTPPKQVPAEQEVPEPKDSPKDSEKENYLLRQLRRRP